MCGGRPQDAAEPLLRPLASACMYLKGRPTRRITENFSLVKLTYLFWAGWNFFLTLKTRLRPNWPCVEVGGGGWGMGEGRGLDFKLNLMPEPRVLGVKTNPPGSSQMLLFSLTGNQKNLPLLSY